jgi:hypothetical protein
MQIRREYYAIGIHVERGLFDNVRYVTFGNEEDYLLVYIDNLRMTKDGFSAVKFHLSKVEKGLAYGFIYNCQDGSPSGFRKIPLDSLSLEEDTLPYECTSQS